MPFVEVVASGVPEERQRLICEQLVVSPTEAPNCGVGIPVPAGWLTEQRMPRSSVAPPLYSPPPDAQPERFTKARKACRLDGRSSTSSRARGGAWPAGAVPRDHRLRHDRRPRPS
jgi:hypothetical protein